MIARTKTGAIVFGARVFFCRDCRLIRATAEKRKLELASLKISQDLISGATAKVSIYALLGMLRVLLNLRKDYLAVRNVLKIVNVLMMIGKNKRQRFAHNWETVDLLKTGLDKLDTRKDTKL